MQKSKNIKEKINLACTPKGVIRQNNHLYEDKKEFSRKRKKEFFCVALKKASKGSFYVRQSSHNSLLRPRK